MTRANSIIKDLQANPASQTALRAARMEIADLNTSQADRLRLMEALSRATTPQTYLGGTATPVDLMPADLLRPTK